MNKFCSNSNRLTSVNINLWSFMTVYTIWNLWSLYRLTAQVVEKNRCRRTEEGETAYARTYIRSCCVRACVRACARDARRRGCARCDAMCDEAAGDVQELWMWCWWFWWGADATHPVCAFRATRVWRYFRSTCPGFVPSRPDHLQSDLHEPNEPPPAPLAISLRPWDPDSFIFRKH